MADIKTEKIDPKAENKPKVDLGLLEEDDEFEEFPADGETTTLTSKLNNSSTIYVQCDHVCIELTHEFLSY